MQKHLRQALPNCLLRQQQLSTSKVQKNPETMYVSRQHYLIKGGYRLPQAILTFLGS